MMNPILLEMLSYKRPARSESEEQFITRYIDTLPEVTDDPFGNRYVRIGNSRTLFSCHTDTVHSGMGRQKIFYDSNTLQAYGTGKDCLGADDCAGVYIMTRLIAHKVPGLYIFHRDEEIGGKGSSYIVDNYSDLLMDYDRAIAFDRAGTNSVITEQFSGICCSDKFANTLGCLVSMDADPTGSFTDTANYKDIIPECTNLAVGYEYAHSHKETLDIDFVELLTARLLSVDFDSLPTARDPYAVETYAVYGQRYSSQSALSLDEAIVARDIGAIFEAVCDDPDEAAQRLYDLTESYNPDSEDYPDLYCA